MAKPDRFAAQTKDAQKTKKKVAAETVKSTKEQQAAEAARLKQEEEQAEEERRQRKQEMAAKEKNGKAAKTSASNTTFAKAQALREEEDDEDEEEVVQAQSAAPTRSKKDEKEAKKKEKSGRKVSDWGLLEEQEREARKQRIKSRLMNMFMLGFFIDTDPASNGGTESNSNKSKKEKIKKNSGRKDESGRGFEMKSIREKAETYGGPLMMLLLVILLGVARISEENYAPDRNRDGEENYYEVLGLPRGENIMAVRKAYKNLALTWHPDKNPGCESCAERFAKISKASEVLTNPESKKAYDENRAQKGALEAANSVELTAENFEQLVLRSNEVWIVQVMDPNDGMCNSFHPVWEEISRKYQGIYRFGRVDVKKNKRVADFLPQRVVLMPMIYRFMRGRDPESFMPVSRDGDGEGFEAGRSFARWVTGTYEELQRFNKAEDVELWWKKGTQNKHARLLMVASQLGATKGETFQKVQSIQHLWGDFAEFAIADQRVVSQALGKDFAVPKGSQFSVFVSSGGSTPKLVTAQSVDNLPIAIQDVIAKAINERVPLVTTRNYQQLCGAGHGGAARTYCLVLVDAPDSGSTELEKSLAQLEESRKTYAQEMLDLASSGEEEENVAEPLHIQPVRIMTSTSRWPWKPPAAGSAFTAVWKEAKYAPAVLIELETRRIAAVKSRSFVDIFQQVAYDDLKLNELPEELSFVRAFPDPEISLRRELMEFVTSVVGAFITFIVVALSVAVVPELSVATAGAAYAGAFVILLVIYPPACRRFLSCFMLGSSSFTF